MNDVVEFDLQKIKEQINKQNEVLRKNAVSGDDCYKWIEFEVSAVEYVVQKVPIFGEVRIGIENELNHYSYFQKTIMMVSCPTETQLKRVIFEGAFIPVSTDTPILGKIRCVEELYEGQYFSEPSYLQRKHCIPRELKECEYAVELVPVRELKNVSFQFVGVK